MQKLVVTGLAAMFVAAGVLESAATENRPERARPTVAVMQAHHLEPEKVQAPLRIDDGSRWGPGGDRGAPGTSGGSLPHDARSTRRLLALPT